MKLPVPVSILNTHTIILGMTGAGKSSVARLFVEHLLQEAISKPLLAIAPTTIIDPKGDWWGLRSSADGRGKGFPVVIFGGDHGDLPLAVESGTVVAEAVLSGNYTSILDLSLLSLGERTRFYTDFATAYYRARTSRFLVIDEAHNFCPKGKIPDPQVGRMLHISNTIASEGRGRGITMLAASQRPQKVHNDFLSSCSTLIAMKVIHPADRQAYKDWLDGAGDKAAAGEILSSAAALPKGTGWVWCVGDPPFGPEKVKFPKYSTYDSFKPQPAGTSVTGQSLPDLNELRGKMATYLEQQAQNDPKKLRATIADLQRQLNSRAPSAPDESDINARIDQVGAEIWEQGFDAGAKAAHREERDHIQSMFTTLQESMIDLMDRVEAKTIPPTVIPPYPGAHSMRVGRITAKPSTSVTVKIEREPLYKSAPVSDQTGRADRTKGQIKILDALAWLNQNGYTAPTREQVSAIANYRGGAFNRAVGELKMLGLVTYPQDGSLWLTPTGESQSQVDESGVTMAGKWQNSLRSEGQRRIFHALCGLPSGRSIHREDLSREINYSGGAFNRAIGELKTMGAVVYPQEGHLALAECVRG